TNTLYENTKEKAATNKTNNLLAATNNHHTTLPNSRICFTGNITNYINNYLFSTPVSTLKPIVDKINQCYNSAEFQNIQDISKKTSELKEKIEILKAQIDKEEKISGPNKEKIVEQKALDKVLPEAYALAKLAIKRIKGFDIYNEQLMGGIVLHQKDFTNSDNRGKIAEMKTGEGKTLAAVLPAYLNALTGKGVHIITANDYLAKRDSEDMGKIFKLLGLTTSYIPSEFDESNSKKRRKLYEADIIYTTLRGLGFDYLRTNRSYDIGSYIQEKPFNYAIVDEADSILIDSASTPLVIAARPSQEDQVYTILISDEMAEIAKYFNYSNEKDSVDDIELNYKDKTLNLNDRGYDKAEELMDKFGWLQPDEMGNKNLYSSENNHLVHLLENALKARYLYKNGVDYIIKDGQIVIIDDKESRTLENNRWSDGLHQAIEAKEKVKIQSDNIEEASVSIQSLFYLFPKLSGITGTASTTSIDTDEFKHIYGIDVVKIPTHKKSRRIDLPDQFFHTKKEKFLKVIEEIKEKHKQQRPILVGTGSIKDSERLARLLEKNGFKKDKDFNLLNAKNDAQEAKIIAQAGKLGAITIATNMAGRGTDIKLGGDHNFADEELLTESQSKEEAGKVRELGGLHIIGTERFPLKRIDEQLKGRAGRQGDPGSTQFFLSLEDDFIKNTTIVDLIDKWDYLTEKMNKITDINASEKTRKECQEYFDKRQESYSHNAAASRIYLYNLTFPTEEHRRNLYEERTDVLFCKDIGKYVEEEIIEKQISSMVDNDLQDLDKNHIDLLCKHILELMPYLCLESKDMFIKVIEPKDILKILLTHKDDKKRAKTELKNELAKAANSSLQVYKELLIKKQIDKIIDAGWDPNNDEHIQFLIQYIKDKYDLDVEEKIIKNIISNINITDNKVQKIKLLKEKLSDLVYEEKLRKNILISYNYHLAEHLNKIKYLKDDALTANLTPQNPTLTNVAYSNNAVELYTNLKDDKIPKLALDLIFRGIVPEED
ncbi:MAG: DEAD/DEAH box helicase, partial [Candidatus Gastranaerophilaceae bacterium]